jgi:hypothetical protein
MKDMKRNGLFGKLGVGLVSLALAGGCASSGRVSNLPSYCSHCYNLADKTLIAADVSGNGRTINFFLMDRQGIANVDIYDSQGRKIDSRKLDGKGSYNFSLDIGGDFEVSAYDGRGKETREKFKKEGDKLIGPAPLSCLD